MLQFGVPVRRVNILVQRVAPIKQIVSVKEVKENKFLN